MKVTYLDAATSEFEEAVAYYNEKRAGLGFEFADEIKEAISRIRNYPEAWAPISDRLRRCVVHRFPYRVIYEKREDLLVIVAIQHHRRAPENWRTRLK